MKIPHIFFLTLIFLFLFSACKKESQPTPGAFGQVTEFGTEKPIANARMELYRCNSDAFGSACFLQDSVFTNSQGRYEISYNPDAASYHILTPVADKYFPGLEKILNSASRVEQDFVLDPHAWLRVHIVNEAPAGELDILRTGNYLSPPGAASIVEFTGSNVNESFLRSIRGERNLSLLYIIKNSGEDEIIVRDTIFIPAHDTLNYEIRY